MNLKIKRLDHHGIVAGVINDLKIVQLIDQYLPQNDKHEISPGEAIKGMIMNGLGFANRPLSLTPQFFENLPLEHLFRSGVTAEHFNRHKLGRTLDQCFDFGCESLFSLISHHVCELENVNTTWQSLDTTSHTLTGEYAFDDKDSDENLITITHGYSKAHRPDLKQVIQEMIVSQDGGIPLACKNWDGNKADTAVFKARSKAIVSSFKNSKMPSYLVADSKLYHSNNAEFLAQLKFITRVPSTIKLERSNIQSAIKTNKWQALDENYRYVINDVTHFDIKQRWMVIHSKAAQSRAEKTIGKQVQRTQVELEKALFHLQAQRFACEADAKRSLSKVLKKAKYHQLKTSELTAHTVYAGKGRPSKDTPIERIDWQISADIEEKPETISEAIEQKSCFVLASNIPESELSAEHILYHYKKQSVVEQGFRFLKDPLFFVSSLFIKKPSRIDSLLMIMTLSLLVYSIAQRRMRSNMERLKMTIPNQIKKETATPTLRWVFQCFEGINLIEYEEDNNVLIQIDGLSELRRKIIQLIGGQAEHLYKIEKSE